MGGPPELHVALRPNHCRIKGALRLGACITQPQSGDSFFLAVAESPRTQRTPRGNLAGRIPAVNGLRKFIPVQKPLLGPSGLLLWFVGPAQAVEWQPLLGVYFYSLEFGILEFLGRLIQRLATWSSSDWVQSEAVFFGKYVACQKPPDLLQRLPRQSNENHTPSFSPPTPKPLPGFINTTF